MRDKRIMVSLTEAQVKKLEKKAKAAFLRPATLAAQILAQSLEASK